MRPYQSLNFRDFVTKEQRFGPIYWLFLAVATLVTLGLYWMIFTQELAISTTAQCLLGGFPVLLWLVYGAVESVKNYGYYRNSSRLYAHFEETQPVSILKEAEVVISNFSRLDPYGRLVNRGYFGQVARYGDPNYNFSCADILYTQHRIAIIGQQLTIFDNQYVKPFILGRSASKHHGFRHVNVTRLTWYANDLRIEFADINRSDTIHMTIKNCEILKQHFKTVNDIHF